MLWTFRAPTMRRNPFLLIFLFFAALFLVPSAYAHRTQGKALSAPVRASRHKQKQAAHASQHKHTRSRRTFAHLRPAVFQRSRRAQPEGDVTIGESESAKPESEEQAPAVETASLPSTRKQMPSPLRGSYESLVRQNEKTEADGLERIEDDADLDDRIARKMLVPFPSPRRSTSTRTCRRTAATADPGRRASSPTWRAPMRPRFMARSKSARRCGPSNTRSN